jgi:NADH-quinone oxidoreductase subunit L
MQTDLLILLIPLLPLIGFIINGIGFRKVPTGLVGLIAAAGPLAAFVCVLLVFDGFTTIAALGKTAPIRTVLFDWITVGHFNIPFSFQIDQLSLIMLLIVTGVGSLIHIYSIGYMKHDDGYGKFMAF